MVVRTSELECDGYCVVATAPFPITNTECGPYLWSVEIGSNVGEVIAKWRLGALDPHVVWVHTSESVWGEEPHVAALDGGDATPWDVGVTGFDARDTDWSCGSHSCVDDGADGGLVVVG